MLLKTTHSTKYLPTILTPYFHFQSLLSCHSKTFSQTRSSSEIVSLAMDVDKEKPVPEKSSTDENNDKIDQSNKDTPKKQEIGTPFAEHDPSPVDADADRKPDENLTDAAVDESSEIKEEGKGEEDANPPEAETPHLPPDLNQVSQEIDEFISTLPSVKAPDDESASPPDVPICVEQFAVLIEAKNQEYDAHENPVKFTQLTDEDSASLLDSVNRLSSLSKALWEFSSEFKYAYSINRIGAVLQHTMSYLEEEFKALAEEHKMENNIVNGANVKQAEESSDQDPPSELAPPEECFFPSYSEEILSNMVKISKTLIAGGYEDECHQVYFVARRNALEESLAKLGFQKFSIDEVQKMSWESLEREIEAWIKTFKYCATVQLSSESKLSNAVFPEYPSFAKDLFGYLSKGVSVQLLNFGRAIMLTKRAPEKLFKFLDVYEALRDVPPEIEKLFPEEWVQDVKTEASMIRGGLGETMIAIVIELENAIKMDSSGKTPVPGGAVHPLTKYIMNYLTYACEYRDTLEQVFREHQKIERSDSTSRSEFDYTAQAQENANQHPPTQPQSPFQSQVSKVMDLLDAYLEGKSKLYRDNSLSSIFLMNNGRYILQKIKGCSEIHTLLGDPWYRKRSSEIRQYHKGYQRETWGKLLNCLHPEGLLVNGKIMKPQVKERFNNFNKLFDEIHKAQSTWVVGDEQLQSELRVSISNMVIPAYRSFLGRFGQVFTPGRQTEKYVKYQPEDIETHIDELFDGNAAPMGKKKM